MRRGAVRTYAAHDVALSIGELVARKRSLTVSVCLPARNEASTVGPIVATVVDRLERIGLVDEVIVVDDGSTDETGAAARAAGARVVASNDVLPHLGPGSGKGEALWKSLAASRGDLVVWCDADLRDFDVRFVTGLLAPLLLHDDVAFVKGFYDRPLDGRPRGGGRVTELVARPLATLLFPTLAEFFQPLAGEYAGRRAALERIPFVQGYGVEIAMLVDLARTVGPGALAQVDLGVRRHRNRPLDELSPQAVAVLWAALERAGVSVPSGPVSITVPGHPSVVVGHSERPPLVEVSGYGCRAS